MGLQNNEQAPQGDAQPASTSQREDKSEWDGEEEAEEQGEEEHEEGEEQMEENGESEANESNDQDASNFVEPNPEDQKVEENQSPSKKRSKRKAPPLSQEGLTKTAADVLSPRQYRPGQHADDLESMTSRKRQRKDNG